MNTLLKRSAFGLVILGITSTSVFAGEKNEKREHAPKRDVVERVNKEEMKNEQALKSGKITVVQAKKLNEEDESVRKEAAEATSKNGGKLSKEDERELNQKENKINRQRARMEKRNKTQAKSSVKVAPSPAPSPANSN